MLTHLGDVNTEDGQLELTAETIVTATVPRKCIYRRG